MESSFFKDKFLFNKICSTSLKVLRWPFQFKLTIRKKFHVCIYIYRVYKELIPVFGKFTLFVSYYILQSYLHVLANIFIP